MGGAGQSGGGGAQAGGGAGAAGGGGGAAGAGGDGACAADPLKTGLVAQQTGISADSFDCQIIAWAAKYNEPDPMVFKAMIYVESRFDNKAVACPNNPCGVPAGWTSAESGCFGLMQIALACGGTPGMIGIGADGQPDTEADPSASGWGNSIFNPDINIEAGIAGVAFNRTQVKAQFSGCTEDQYTMMAVGNYNSYGSTKGCAVVNADYDDAVIAAYQQYATAAGYPAHSY
jgi:soluble lytic murein transglycosylase-like protein